MEKLFIKIKDGQPFEHPMTLESIQYIVPNFDPNNIPEGFAVFEDVHFESNPAPFDVDDYKYVIDGAIVKKVWFTRKMTDAERVIYLEDLTQQLYRDKEAKLAMGQESLDAAAIEYKWHWQQYLNDLNAWVLVDPLEPKWPTPPQVQPDGTLISNYVVGTPPNVID